MSIDLYSMSSSKIANRISMNELTAMTNTSREALVVFAENVDGVKVALEKLESGYCRFAN